MHTQCVHTPEDVAARCTESRIVLCVRVHVVESHSEVYRTTVTYKDGKTYFLFAVNVIVNLSLTKNTKRNV